MTPERTRRAHAVKVALAATAVVGAAAIVVAVSFNVLVGRHLLAGVDDRLSQRLAHISGARPTPATGPESTIPPSVDVRRDGDLDDVPLFLWHVAADGTATPLTAGAPALPNRHWTDGPVSLPVGGTNFRLDAVPSGPGWLVAGEGVGDQTRVGTEVLVAELILGSLLLVVTFTGSLIVGLRASAPIEQVRRRQAEFTADASHELRTPLSVIEAEVDLALSRPRDGDSYRRTLATVAAESARLRSIVGDLLWLARADGDGPGPTATGPVDLADVTRSCVDRVTPVAEADGVSLSFRHDPGGPCRIRTSVEALERLVGVLVDNAIRYGGPDGRVEVSVGRTGHRVTLTVDDAGPGIPEEHRDHIFDRFHRASPDQTGTGLGLAIADAVVRSSEGTWSVGRSPLGGARMAVTWRAEPVGLSDRSTDAAPTTDGGGGGREVPSAAGHPPVR